MRLGLAFITAVFCKPLDFETLMMMQNEPNGIGNEVFFNGNEGVKEHYPIIQMLLAGNKKDMGDLGVADDIALVKDNVSFKKTKKN